MTGLAKGKAASVGKRTRAILIAACIIASALNAYIIYSGVFSTKR